MNFPSKLYVFLPQKNHKKLMSTPDTYRTVNSSKRNTILKLYFNQIYCLPKISTSSIHNHPTCQKCVILVHKKSETS